MKHTLAALVAAPLLFTGVASAERTLSTSQFLQANRCVAYASLPALQANPVDLSAVQARIAAARPSQTAMNMLSVQSVKRDAVDRGARADTPAEVDALLARRDRYCASFVDATQLAARAGTTSQQ